MKNFAEWLEVRDQEFHDSINENLKERLKLGALMGAQAAGIAGLGGLHYKYNIPHEPEMPQVSHGIDKPIVSITDAVKNKHNRVVNSVQQQLGVSKSGETAYDRAYNRNDSIKGDKLITTFEIKFESEKAKAEALASINALNHYIRGGVVKLSDAPRFSSYSNESTGLYTVSIMTYPD